MNDQTRIRVLSVDDHPLLREGIATLINNQLDMCVVGEAYGCQAPRYKRLSTYRCRVIVGLTEMGIRCVQRQAAY